MNQIRQLALPSNGNSQEADFNSGSLFFIGNATVLLRYAGLTILTDPNFLHQGNHVHLGYGIRSARRTNPAMEIEDLPALDMVVLSHMHEDHFDRVAEAKLNKNLPIITTHQAASSLESKGFSASQALNTWETMTVTKNDAWVRITAMPGRHGPQILSALLPSVNGNMLEFGSTIDIDKTLFRLYISGDTLMYEDIKAIPQKYPDIDLALLHLGGTKILGILLTMDAKQGVQAIEIIAPDLSIPIHYNDYTVMKSSLEEFMQAVTEAGLDERVKYLSHGETYTFDVSGK
ncbi:MBL fold metallo-hydrolase [Plectonema cf. radiosum LEGE 06105]|uniref:MBL fold metallo-hydrolase n=1 Tax=Plectonema cf. radiosum LEGE 06105 TaxID=945769 RepID=A0A8J7JS91_9CYAN|nr:MBL fold metallo-hydrolase [Plectonema radiosum]MBE9212249.1 MBL fold metallo-hydrolase [Plectonema cf. radiosum LEGE 06105]